MYSPMHRRCCIACFIVFSLMTSIVELHDRLVPPPYCSQLPCIDNLGPPAHDVYFYDHQAGIAHLTDHPWA